MKGKTKAPMFVILLAALLAALPRVMPANRGGNSLPVDPIFFQKLISDPRQFEDFLLSNANIGRAEVSQCLRLTTQPNTATPPTADDSSATTGAAEEFRVSLENVRNVEEEISSTETADPVGETPYWVVGKCFNNFSIQTVVGKTSVARKFLIMRIDQMDPKAWPYLHELVQGRTYIILNWPVVMGPGSDSAYTNPLRLPDDLSDVHGVMLSFLEGTTSMDNEDDRYWYYHYEQMGTMMELPQMRKVPIKLVAFNGLYLTRSTAPDLGNCDRATGYFHYLNDKDTVRLNTRAYKQRIENYSMIKRYNVWAISEFLSPDFSRAKPCLRTFTWVQRTIVILMCILINWGE